MNPLNLLVLLLLATLTMGKKNKRMPSKKKILAVDSDSRQCACGNGFAVKKLHVKSIKVGIVIAGTEMVGLQICDACAKTCIGKKICMLLVQNGLDTAAVENQDESLLYPSQAREYGYVAEDVTYVHSGNQRAHVSDTRITL